MSNSPMVSKLDAKMMRGSLEALCRLAAMAGGCLVVALAFMTVASILGRWLAGTSLVSGLPLFDWIGPVKGDYEIVEMGTALAVFLFLPYCHLRGGHVTVDLLVMNAPKPVQRLLGFVAEVLFLAVAVLMTWRLYHGLLDKRRYMETSMLLDIPLWWGYVGGIAGLALLALVCLYRTTDVLTCGSARHGEAQDGSAQGGA